MRAYSQFGRWGLSECPLWQVLLYDNGVGGHVFITRMVFSHKDGLQRYGYALSLICLCLEALPKVYSNRQNNAAVRNLITAADPCCIHCIAFVAILCKVSIECDTATEKQAISLACVTLFKSANSAFALRNTETRTTKLGSARPVVISCHCFFSRCSYF